MGHYSYEVINSVTLITISSPTCTACKKGEVILSTNLDHADTRVNINKKIWKQIIDLDLHKLLLAFHMGKRFIADSLSTHWLEKDLEISILRFLIELYSNIKWKKKEERITEKERIQLH